MGPPFSDSCTGPSPIVYPCMPTYARSGALSSSARWVSTIPASAHPCSNVCETATRFFPDIDVTFAK